MERGWVAIPIPRESKKPTLSGWQDRTLQDVDADEDFADNDNLGVVLGDPSGGLVDIDLDCPEAIRAASGVLPDTGLIFGRQSNPTSHWIYKVAKPQGRVTYTSPRGGGMLLEYRANGCQTLFPPSVHENKDKVAFHRDDLPATVDRDELLEACCRLAAISLIAQAWIEGSRHDLALALSGALLNSGWGLGDVEDFITPICRAANDNDEADRIKCARDTNDNRLEGRSTTGWPRLASAMGEQQVEQIRQWLGLPAHDERPGIGHNSSPADITDMSMTDIGNADEFVADHGDLVRYCVDMGHWLIWDGKRWAKDDQLQINNLAERTMRRLIEGMPATGDSERELAYRNWRLQSGRKARIQAMLDLSRYRVNIGSLELDANSFLLNCNNGTLDLRTGKLRPHGQGDYITKLVDVDYDPAAHSPLFEAFLKKITNDDLELVAFLKRSIGYSLTASNEEQCFFIGHGSGANGKSTFLNVVEHLLGDFAMHTPVSTLMAKTGGSGIPNDLARLKGARFVTASEAEVSDRFAESLIKQLTGGDKITARYLHKEFFEFVPCCKLWLATNYPPKIKGTDHAIWRRIHLIPFDVSIPEDEQDHQLLDKLMAELPGILSWAVAGCLEWQREGLNPPDRVTRATREYREDMDEYADFLSDALIATKGTKVPKRDMHDAFLSWSRAKGVESLSKREFGTLLKHAGYSEIRSKKTRYWNDVALSPEFEGTGYV